jgi:serralysin
MATPTSNFVPTSILASRVLGDALAMLSGTKWGGPLAPTPLTLTYSFPTGFASFISGYSNGTNGEWGSWYQATTSERAAFTAALGAWASVSGLRFVQVADNAATVGEIRFALTDVGLATEAGHAYSPTDHPSAGDVWMKQGSWHVLRDSAVARGSYDYLSLLHEIGHAIGLKHPFEGAAILPAGFDSYFYTVMSYSAKPGLDNYASFYPTTPMYWDMVAAQLLYGVDSATNAGNNTYTFLQGRHYWQTIYDAGGSDTIIYKGSRDCTINLNWAAFSALSDPISFSDGSTSRTTVCIGPHTMIERAVGGAGNDLLVGNWIANTLNGAAGNDSLSGAAGNDRLIGGPGTDRLIGGSGADVFDFNSARESLVGPRHDVVTFARANRDKIDLSTIDADIDGTGGNQAFRWIGANAFSGADGQLRFARGVLQGDTNGDKVADFEIRIFGGLAAADVIL